MSTAALLGSGFSTSTEIPCTSVANVGGQLFSDQQLASSLGADTLFSTDFAQGCGTAFAGLSRRLTSSALTTAVNGFGIGSKWQLPLQAFSGSVPAATTDGQLAGETIGQGVQVSPLGMALIAAEVDSGVWRSPVLVTRPPDGAASIRSPLTPGALTSLRALMREAVTSGSANSANASGAPVYGQTALVRTGRPRRPVAELVCRLPRRRRVHSPDLQPIGRGLRVRPGRPVPQRPPRQLTRLVTYSLLNSL